MFLFDLGIDMGSTKTTIYVEGKGVVLNEPSVVAIDSETEKIIAVGRRARRMVGRNPDSITVVYPIKNGVVSNFTLAEHMIRTFVQKVCKNSMVKPRAVVAIPSEITNVDRITISDVIMSAGVRKACLVEKPLLAAYGAGVEFGAKRGSIIIDIGAGTTDAAIVTYGGLALNASLKIGGETIDEEIIKYIRTKYNLNIGVRTAENIKKDIGCAVRPFTEVNMSVKGIDYATGLPMVIEVSNNEIYDVILPVLKDISGVLSIILEQTPPELIADISIEGILICGGVANLTGIADYFTQTLRIDASVVTEPEFCAARGTGPVMRHMRELKAFGYQYRSIEKADVPGVDDSEFQDV